MTQKLHGNKLADLLIVFPPGRALYILKRQKYDRLFPLIICIFRSTLPNQLILKINGSIFFRLLKKDTEHIHVQCFSKTPWSRKQCHFRPIVQKITYEKGVVNIIVFRGCRSEIWNSYWKRYFLFHRALFRNKPWTPFLTAPGISPALHLFILIIIICFIAK